MEGVEGKKYQLMSKWKIKDSAGMFKHSLEEKGLSDDRSPLRIEAAQQVGEALQESDAEAKRAIICIFARRPPKQKVGLSLYLQSSSFIELGPPTAAEPAEVQIAYLLWKCKGEAISLRAVAHCVERFPGRRRDTSGLLELALGVLDAFRSQMQRAVHKPAPLLISAEESVTVEQPEPQNKSRPSSIAYGVPQQHPVSKRTRSTGRFVSSKLEVIEVSEDSESAETGGKNEGRVCGADPVALGTRSAHAGEDCGDNFSAEGQVADAESVPLAAPADVINARTDRLGTVRGTQATVPKVDASGESGHLDELTIADPAFPEQAGKPHESQHRGGKLNRDAESGARDQDSITAASGCEGVQIGSRDAGGELTDGVSAQNHREPPARAGKEGPVVKRARRE